MLSMLGVRSWAKPHHYFTVTKHMDNQYGCLTQIFDWQNPVKTVFTIDHTIRETDQL